MSLRLLVLLPLLLVFPTARAAGGHGQSAAPPAWWPEVESFTTGRMQGFVSISGDPKAIVAKVKPAKPAKAGGSGDLHIVNERGAPAIVWLGNQQIGVLGPFREGVVHNVPAGSYTATFQVFHGYTWSVPLQTQAPAKG